MQDRDLVGYGPTPPRVRWPHAARVAISLVVNYEEGSENLLQDGIGRRELVGEGPSPVPPDRRDLANESIFEYGSRAGVWRLLRIFKKHGVRATFFSTNADRLAYPTFRAQGFPVGSGAVESAARDVILLCMKRPGMRWADAGGRAIAALRATIRSNRSLVA